MHSIFVIDSSLGIAEKSNLDFRMAQKVHLAVMGADDIAVPHRFPLQIAFLERNSWICVVGASMYVHSGLAQKKIRSARLTDIQRIFLLRRISFIILP